MYNAWELKEHPQCHLGVFTPCMHIHVSHTNMHLAICVAYNLVTKRCSNGIRSPHNIACPGGTFSDTVSNEPCLPCPGNSVQEPAQTGLTTECPCIHGYYKAPIDEHSLPCTRKLLHSLKQISVISAYIYMYI